jgi:translation initiation factor IF-1
MPTNFRPSSPSNSKKPSKPFKPANAGGGNKKRKRKEHSYDENKTYLQGVVTEALPGTRFKVKVERSKGLEPLVIECNLKTMFKARNIKIIKGDNVEIEIDPIDPNLKGTIVNRILAQ